MPDQSMTLFSKAMNLLDEHSICSLKLLKKLNYNKNTVQFLRFFG